MKNFADLNRVLHLFALCFLFTGVFQKTQAQCTSALPGMTVNGVAITGGGTYVIRGGTQTACTYTTPENSLRTTNEFSGPTYNFTFSKPVNNLRFVLTGSFDRFDFWRIIFTTNKGGPSIEITGSCNNFAANGDYVYSDYRRATGALGGGEFIVSVPGGFTSLGFHSLSNIDESIALCAESVIPCPDVPVLSAITQPRCTNITGSFAITNYDAANTYTVSPAANTSISSTGIVTVPAGGSYTITAGNATCTSVASIAAVVNNIICAEADEFTVSTDQTLTENLQANDGYIPPGTTYFIPQPDPAYTNPSACVPLVVNDSPDQKILTFSCGTVGIYHFLVPVAVGQTRVQVPLTITVTTPLPVTLISFKAVKEEQTVNLVWETSEETNSDRFEVDWGIDGKVWNSIGSVGAANESQALRKYSFQHITPATGENLYRLRMMDQDHTFAYSRIINVNFEADFDNAVYPNPVTGGKLQLANWTDIKTLELYNMQGRKVANFQPAEKETMFVSNLQSGLYVIKVIRHNGTSTAWNVLINN